MTVAGRCACRCGEPTRNIQEIAERVAGEDSYIAHLWIEGMQLNNAVLGAHKRSLAHAARVAARVSIADYVEAALSSCGMMADAAAVERAHLASSDLAESSGEYPNGMWMPLALGRTLTVGSATQAGNLASAAVLGADLIPALRPYSGVIAAGATIITGLQGQTVSLPRMSSAVVPQWVSEEGISANPDPAYDQCVIRPRTLSATVTFSRRLAMNTSLRNGFEQALRTELIAAVMSEVDRVALAGSGAGQEPTGIISDAGVPSVAAGVNGGAPTLALLAEMERVHGESFGKPATGWFGNAAVREALRNTRRAADLDFLMPAESQDLLGRPYASTEHVPGDLTKGTGVDLSALILGHWPAVIVGFWGPAAVDLLVDPITLARQGLIRLTALAEVGVALSNPEAFVRCTDLATS